MDMEKILKCLRLTTSDQDGEALSAIRMANMLLKKGGHDWEKLLTPKVNQNSGFDLEMVDKAAKLLFERWKIDYLKANAPKPVYRSPAKQMPKTSSYRGFRKNEKGNWHNFMQKCTVFDKNEDDEWGWVKEGTFSSTKFDSAFAAIDDYFEENE